MNGEGPSSERGSERGEQGRGEVRRREELKTRMAKVKMAVSLSLIDV